MQDRIKCAAVLGGCSKPLYDELLGKTHASLRSGIWAQACPLDAVVEVDGAPLCQGHYERRLQMGLPGKLAPQAMVRLDEVKPV